MDKRLFAEIQTIKPILAKLALLTCLQTAAILIQSYFLAAAISSLFWGDLFREAGKKLIIFFLAFLTRQLLTVWKKQLSFHFAAQMSQSIRESLLQKLFQLGPRFIKELGSGVSVTLVLEGIMKYRRYLEIIFAKTINTLIIPVGIVLFIFSINIRSAVIFIVTLPILVVFFILLGLAAKYKANRQYKSFQLLSNHFVDSLRGLETLKFLGLSKSHGDKISAVSEKYRLATMSVLRIAFLSSFSLEFFTMLSVATVAVFLGLGLINGQIDLQSALTVLILAPEYFLPIREMGADYHATLDGKNAGEQINEILDKETGKYTEMAIPAWTASSIFSIRKMNVTYTNENESALKDLDFTISGVKKFGIIGASGAGKSTLLELLCGFLTPTSGGFWINGERVDSLSTIAWQKQVTYIPQYPYIFNDTVLNNIRFYNPEATEQEAADAAIKAGLMKLMESFPEGLLTMIGEGGRALSGGQEQRIAIARAFLENRPIIMLDEPTAHLDIETEAELKETMLDLFSGKLVLLATHRLHWMLDMDEIIVMDQGRIAEIGTHKQLMARKSVYFRLAAMLKGEELIEQR